LHFPTGELAQEHQAINRVLATLDERRRRLFVGLLASQRGHGGVVQLARVTGMSRTTIRRGMLELEEAPPLDPRRVRRPGGGGQALEKKTRRW
jgi:DeoR/GlpR family transcriptional regulator of sugar metabolism